ncbi:MAG: TonB-dependent receptor [Rhodocyclaceae bacterium]
MHCDNPMRAKNSTRPGRARPKPSSGEGWFAGPYGQRQACRARQVFRTPIGKRLRRYSPGAHQNGAGPISREHMKRPHKKRAPRWAAACTTSLLAAHAGAATDESTYLGDLPVVLSASRLAQPLQDAPGAVTVIDRDQIRASGARDIADVLKLVPGFVTTLAYGSYPAVGYHGLTRERSSRMQVLIDGRSAYSPYFLGGIEWNQLGVDIDDVERIEVFRGSNSASYGANAFLGVVSITTRSAHDSEKLSLNAQRGDDGIRDTSAAATLAAGDLSMRIRGREQRDDGFENAYDGRHIRLADLRGDYRLSNAQSVEFHVGGTHADIRHGYPAEAGDPPRTTSMQTSYALLRFRQALDAGDEWSVTYYHQQEQQSDAFTQTYPLNKILSPSIRNRHGLPDVLTLTVDAAYDTRRDDIEFERIQALTDTLRVVWGAAWREDRLHAPLHFNQRQTVAVQDVQGFGNFEWRPTAHWTVNAGAMAENTSLSGTKAAPRVGVNYHVDAQQTVRAAWSRAWRAPTPYEQWSDTQYTYNGTVLRWTDKPADTLKPEKITAIELGYLAQWQATDLSLDTRLFNEKVEDLIQDIKVQLNVPQDQLDPTRTEVRSSVNGSWARMTGLEYQLTWRPLQTSWISLAQTFMNIRSDNPKSLMSAPHVATVVTAAHRFDSGVSLSISHYRYGRMNWQQTEQETIAPYHRTDLRAAYAFAIGRSRAEAYVVAQNLGQSNAEYKPIYQIDARYFAGIRWEY